MSNVIDPMESSFHHGDQLLNIVSGEMVPEKANPYEAVARENSLIQKFRSSWPESSRATITMPVILMDTKGRCVKIGNHQVYDQTFIFAQIFGLMMNNPDNISMKLVS